MRFTSSLRKTMNTSGTAGGIVKPEIMKIIEHQEAFEVRSDDGSTVKQFPFDDNPGRRAISGLMKRKAALQAAKAFAGKGYVMAEKGRVR
jgi:hypothetical protein